MQLWSKLQIKTVEMFPVIYMYYTSLLNDGQLHASGPFEYDPLLLCVKIDACPETWYFSFVLDTFNFLVNLL